MRYVLLLLLVVPSVSFAAVDEAVELVSGDVLMWADRPHPLLSAVSMYARHMGVHASFEDIEDEAVPFGATKTLGIRLDGAPLETMLEQFRVAIQAYWPGRRIVFVLPSGGMWTEGHPGRLAQVRPPVDVGDYWVDIIGAAKSALVAEGRRCVSLNMYISIDKQLWGQVASSATSLEEALMTYAARDPGVVWVWYFVPLNSARRDDMGQVVYQFDGFSRRFERADDPDKQAYMLFAVMSRHPLARATMAAAVASPPHERVGVYEYALPSLPPRQQRGRMIKNIYFHSDGSVDDWSVRSFEIMISFTNPNAWLHAVASDRRMHRHDDNVRCGYLASYVNIGDSRSLWEEEVAREEQVDVRTVGDCVRLAIAVGARRDLTVQSVVPDALLQHALRPADPDSRTLAELFRARMPPEATGLWHLIQTSDGDTRDLGHWPVPEGVELFEAPNEGLLTEP